jgi:hypothetical protein
MGIRTFSLFEYNILSLCASIRQAAFAEIDGKPLSIALQNSVQKGKKRAKMRENTLIVNALFIKTHLGKLY